MSEINVRKLTKKFKDVLAVDDLTFSFPEGQVTCLLGPSGCGKTTLLRMIAGLETPTHGNIFMGDTQITRLPPRKRNIGMVFQYPVVYRGISVYKNIELPLLKRRLPEKERKKRIDEVLELLNLQDQADMENAQLDNVSRQKVAVARAIAYRPEIILFDEPMTNIDANSRIQFKHFFKALSKKLRQVIIYVTHDQTEAMTLADRIALMKNGRIVQCNEPRVLYNEPEDVFGGWFLGNPGMNFITARREMKNGRNRIDSGFLRSPLILNTDAADAELIIGIRPEQIRISASPFDTAVRVAVKRRSITVGGQYIFVVGIDGVEIKAKTRNPSGDLIHATSVWIELPVNQMVLFDENQHRIHAEITKS